MDKYLEAEKELAELLGWVNVRNYLNFSESPLIGLAKGHYGTTDVPCWCRDDAQAFRLMVEYDCHSDELFSGAMSSGYWDNDGNHNVHNEIISDHPDKLTATRYAIVQAVIQKLRSEVDGQA